MTVSRGDVAGKSEYQEKTYYFCSLACKGRFDADPQTYVVQRIADLTSKRP
jgi:YHS domain-containing protein